MEFRIPDKKNAFLHPDESDAVFPQVVPAPIIDLRSSAIPGSGREWSGARVKNKTVTQEFKNYDQLEEEVNIGEEQAEAEEMKEEKAPGVSYKVKKTRKSKLRKTIVF